MQLKRSGKETRNEKERERRNKVGEQQLKQQHSRDALKDEENECMYVCKLYE